MGESVYTEKLTFLKALWETQDNHNTLLDIHSNETMPVIITEREGGIKKLRSQTDLRP